MKALKMFVDIHDTANDTLPQGLTEEALAGVLKSYQFECEKEGVVLLKVDVGLAEGRAFCYTLAESAAAVKKVHDAIGLKYDSITEVKTASPGSLFWSADEAAA